MQALLTLILQALGLIHHLALFPFIQEKAGSDKTRKCPVERCMCCKGIVWGFVNVVLLDTLIVGSTLPGWRTINTDNTMYCGEWGQ